VLRACVRVLCESVGVRECLYRGDIRKEVKVGEKGKSGAIEDAESETVKQTKGEAKGNKRLVTSPCQKPLTFLSLKCYIDRPSSMVRNLFGHKTYTLLERAIGPNVHLA